MSQGAGGPFDKGSNQCITPRPPLRNTQLLPFDGPITLVDKREPLPASLGVGRPL